MAQWKTRDTQNIFPAGSNPASDTMPVYPKGTGACPRSRWRAACGFESRRRHYKKKREAIPLFLVFSTMYGKPVFDVIVYTDLVAIFFGKLKIGGCTTTLSIPESKCSAVREMGNKPVHLFVSDRPGFLTKIVPVCLHDDQMVVVFLGVALCHLISTFCSAGNNYDFLILFGR